jgi:threonylcarbamoyladenosine tRNA methylthiotransferase MtaB
MRIAVYTFGCKLNQCESEAIAAAFRENGFHIVPIDTSPDLVIINTCTVTSKSEQKARKLIRKTAREHPESPLIVTGCYAQVDSETIRGLKENIIVLDQEHKDILLALPHHLADGALETTSEAIRDWIASRAAAPASTQKRFRYRGDSLVFHTRPFLKIQDGCNNYCAYCRVPYARGPSISLDSATVLSRLEQLEEAGHREVVITGVNITDYHWEECRLEGLLSHALRRTHNLRFRLSSLEPDQLDEKLLQVLTDSRICPHFHIPVQSGSDKILSLMKRNYTTDTIKRVVKQFREVKENPFIGADVLIGFPGEGEDDFMQTEQLIQELDLTTLHVFPFSPRPGTPACRYPDHVSERIVKERIARLLDISEQKLHTYRSQWIGKEVQVLLEQQKSNGTEPGCHGLSENYLRVSVSGVPGDLQKRGTLVTARITGMEKGAEGCVATFLYSA